MVVIIIFGILTAIALPSISKSMTTSTVDRASQVVLDDIEAAFSLAAREQRPVTLTVNSVALTYTIRDRATSSVLQTRVFGGPNAALRMTGLTSTASPVTFFPNGLASTGFTITITAVLDRRAVVATRTGQMRVIVP